MSDKVSLSDDQIREKLAVYEFKKDGRGARVCRDLLEARRLLRVANFHLGCSGEYPFQDEVEKFAGELKKGDMGNG